MIGPFRKDLEVKRSIFSNIVQNVVFVRSKVKVRQHDGSTVRLGSDLSSVLVLLLLSSSSGNRALAATYYIGF